MLTVAVSLSTCSFLFCVIYCFAFQQPCSASHRPSTALCSVLLLLLLLSLLSSSPLVVSCMFCSFCCLDEGCCAVRSGLAPATPRFASVPVFLSDFMFNCSSGLHCVATALRLGSLSSLVLLPPLRWRHCRHSLLLRTC